MTAAADPAVTVEGLTKRFRDRIVLAGLDLAVPRGVLFGLLGLNGAGKTTTLRILLGLLEPDAGASALLGVPSSRMHRLAGRLGAQLHGEGLDLRLSARDNLRLHALRHGRRGDHARRSARGDAVLERLGLSALRDRRAARLSQGERQRLALACALLLEPELLILDEPLSNLDPGAVRLVLEILRDEVRRRGATVLLSSHQLEHVERSADRVALIHRGRVTREGTVGELLAAEHALLIAAAPGDRAREILQQMQGVQRVEVPGPREAPLEQAAARRSGATLLRVTVAAEQAAELNTALIAAGARVSLLVPERRSLDDVFHALTAQEGAAPTAAPTEAAAGESRGGEAA